MGKEEKEVDTVPFGTFRKSLFNDLGPYDERLVRNQDIELNARIRKRGGKIFISPELAYHLSDGLVVIAEIDDNPERDYAFIDPATAARLEKIDPNRILFWSKGDADS